MKRKSEEPPILSAKRKAYDRPENINDTWFQLFQSSLQSFADADYDAVINSSLQALKQLDTFKTMVLDTCASAYAMKCNFDKAMKAAEKMIECTPTTATGYLRAGDTLALQGKHLRAIEVYDQGASKVSSNDGEYILLKDGISISQIQLEKRIDFFTLLPVDVVYIIVDQLDITDSHIECMDVSKKWRHILADYGKAWKEISLEFYDANNPIFRFLPVIGKHTTKLELLELESDASQEISTALLNGQLSNLQHLNVNKGHIGRHQLLLILSRLGNSLTELILIIDENDHALPLESILIACPKLELLRYHIGKGSMEFSDANPVAGDCNIKLLELNAEVLASEELCETIRRCPHLQELRVEVCTADALRLIYDHCPHLKTLGFNGPATNMVLSSTDDRPGIQQLYIHDTNELGPEHVIPLVEKFQSTLQNAVLALSDDSNDISRRWNALTQVNPINLRYFTYCFGSCMDMHTIVAKMIRNSKALQYVSLQDLNNVSNNVLEEALLLLPNLVQITLVDMEIVNSDGFEYFLNAHATRGKSSSLREVYLENCDNVPDSLLQALANVETLSYVKIQKCTGITKLGLISFMDQVRRFNTLEEIHLESMDIVSDAVLYHLGNVVSLRNITLSSLSMITADALKELVGVLTNLEDISIVHCAKISLLTSYKIKSELRAKKKERATLENSAESQNVT